MQIDVDDDTGNATDVDVEANLWKTNRTEAAVETNESSLKRGRNVESVGATAATGWVRIARKEAERPESW